MKKYIFLLFILFCSIHLIKSQVLNADFENWDTLSGIEKPTDWYTNNSIGSPCAIKSIDSYTGKYAMNLRSEDLFWEGKGGGYAAQIFVGTGMDTLKASIRIDSIGDYGKVVIKIKRYVPGQPTSLIGYWEDSVVYQNYKVISIPFDQNYIIDTLMIELFADVFDTGFGYKGYSSFHIDGISLFTTVGIKEKIFWKSIGIHPNPIQENFRLENTANLKINELKLYDLNGKMVKNFNVQQASYTIGELAEGLYFLRIYTDEGIAVKKLVKSK